MIQLLQPENLQKMILSVRHWQFVNLQAITSARSPEQYSEDNDDYVLSVSKLSHKPTDFVNSKMCTIPQRWNRARIFDP